MDLKPNGSSIPVTNENVIEYIYRYVEYRMITLAAKPLEVRLEMLVSLVHIRGRICSKPELFSVVMQIYSKAPCIAHGGSETVVTDLGLRVCAR